MKIAHLSDLHFGRIARPGILDILADQINEAGVDLVAISGDFTQRALHRQFREAQAWLKRLTAPILLVPGNHDVLPWWRPGLRLFSPLARFGNYLGKETVRSFEKEGLAVLGINSAHGRTIKGGRIAPEVDRAMATFFEEAGRSSFKVLVLHHHLVALKGLMPHDTAAFGTKTFETAARAGVDLILCGHIHVSHVETLDGFDGANIVIASAGTATSSRGRRTNRHQNYFNLIEVSPDQFLIREYQYSLSEGVFQEVRINQFNR
jgi:3',5'-cyclic AMP phosphodiesterase CpdA